MGIIKGLIFVIVFLSPLAVIYRTEFNISALICMVAAILIFIMYILSTKRALRQQTNEYRDLQERLLSQRNYFTEVLVHDLKVPALAQLRGLELLRKEFVGPLNSSQKEMLCQIEQSCKYTLDMISMVLATYKLELEEYEFSYERINIPELLLESFVETSYLAQEKNVSYTYMATQEKAIAEADRAEIKKVIVNLLTTAVMHSGRGEKILVNITTNEKNLKFSIITRGKALSSQECTEMFSDYSINNPKYTTVGHDISLYLSKKIIDAHGGRIYASSDGIATNTFNFIIPQIREEAVVERVCPAFV